MQENTADGGRARGFQPEPIKLGAGPPRAEVPVCSYPREECPFPRYPHFSQIEQENKDLPKTGISLYCLCSKYWETIQDLQVTQAIVPTSDDAVKMQLEQKLQSAIQAAGASSVTLCKAQDVTQNPDASAIRPVLTETIPRDALRASEKTPVLSWPRAVVASRAAQPQGWPQIASFLPHPLSTENSRMGTATTVAPVSIQPDTLPLQAQPQPQPQQRDGRENDDFRNAGSDPDSVQDHDQNRDQGQGQDQHQEVAATGLPHEVQMAAFRLHSRNGKWINVFRKLRQDIYASKLSGVMRERGLKEWDILNLSMDELREIWRVTHRRWHSSARCRMRTSGGAANESPGRNHLSDSQNTLEVDQN